MKVDDTVLVYHVFISFLSGVFCKYEMIVYAEKNVAYLFKNLLLNMFLWEEYTGIIISCFIVI